MKDSGDAFQRLVDNGLKLTPFRRKLVQAFLDARMPLSAAQLSERLFKSKSRREFDRVTLFRNLKSLMEKDILNATEFGTGATFYCLNTARGMHHHHVFCVRCETARSLDACGAGPLMEQAQNMGFEVLGHRLELTGVCPKCRSNPSRPSREVRR